MRTENLWKIAKDLDIAKSTNGDSQKVWGRQE